MEKEKQPEQANAPAPADESESLEAQTTVVEGETPANGGASAGGTTDGTTPAAGGAPAGDGKQPDDKKKKKPKTPLKGLMARFNIYFLLFIFLLVIAGVVTAISMIRSKQVENPENQIKTEPLSKEALEQLRQTDVKVGDPKQILSVESNAVFAGNVLIRDTLEVAGEIKAGGALNLPGITVTGTSTLNQVTANILQVSGNTTIQGQLAVQNNLSVAGSASVGGTLTAGRLNIQDLQVSGDLQITRHIDAGGGTPGLSGGGALGAGGTSSVSGTDTAGTVAVNAGGGPGAGCFANITFAQRFNSTPHVVVTPVGSAAGGLNWYINRSATGFSICTTNSAGAGQSFAFDYIVID